MELICASGPESEVELESILAGETCPPLSLRDFAVYTRDSEHSEENVLFHLAIARYTEGYTRVIARDSRVSVVKTLKHSLSSPNKAAAPFANNVAPNASNNPPPTLTPEVSTDVNKVPNNAVPEFVLSSFGDDFEPPKMDPLQRRKIPSTAEELIQEVHFITDEFMNVGASMEVNITAAARKAALEELRLSLKNRLPPEPRVFHEVDREIKHLMRSYSLPKFIRDAATSNIKSTKTKINRFLAMIIDLVIVLTISLATALTYSSPYIRFVAFPFMCHGMCAVFTVKDNFCFWHGTMGTYELVDEGQTFVMQISEPVMKAWHNKKLMTLSYLSAIIGLCLTVALVFAIPPYF
ncbi:hypothetical protein SeMB42_g01581 [Synchytrium endobioticum]|nr:hypothetical protein SeMB42_g01581 [Synchytrium endobioticum]